MPIRANIKTALNIIVNKIRAAVESPLSAINLPNTKFPIIIKIQNFNPVGKAPANLCIIPDFVAGFERQEE